MIKRRAKTELTMKKNEDNLLHVGDSKFCKEWDKEFKLEPLEGNRFRGCKIPGCPGEKFALGFCQPHYQRNHKYGDPLHVPPAYSINRNPKRGRQPYRMSAEQKQHLSELNKKICAERKAKREQQVKVR